MDIEIDEDVLVDAIELIGKGLYWDALQAIRFAVNTDEKRIHNAISDSLGKVPRPW